MKIGVIVDGQAEPEALMRLFEKLKVPPGMRPRRPLYADLQPKASWGQIAQKTLSRVRMLQAQGVRRIVILMDREDRRECAPEIAAQVGRAVERIAKVKAVVVVKDRKLENWLISDTNALRSLRGMFRVPRSLDGEVSPDKADHVSDAEAALNRVAVGNAYHKRSDPVKIMGAMSLGDAAANSRSLRRFLRVLGDTRYAKQSKRAAISA